MDENTTSRRWGRLLTAGIAGAAALGLATATSAAADTSTATANAANVSLLNGGLRVADSGTATATNAGSGTQTTAQAPLLSVLGGQGGITAGALVQTAVARADGTSAACAGLVGSGGSISVGTDGTCTFSGGGAGGVRISLLGAAYLQADALLASCTADSTGAVTGRVQLANAKVLTPKLIGSGTTTLATLSADPSENDAADVAGIARIGLRLTTKPGDGSIRTSALGITVLGATTSLTIGTVTCGANAKTVPASALPGPALPLSAVALVAAGLRFRRPVLDVLTSRSTRRG